MGKTFIYEDALNYKGEERIGDECKKAILDSLKGNYAVGVLIGRYDEKLSILAVSDLLLNGFGLEYDELLSYTGGSLKKLFHGEVVSEMDVERFQRFQGAGEGAIIKRDGVAEEVRVFKTDTVDENGETLWVMSVQFDVARQNLNLINRVIKSGMWTIHCSKDGTINQVIWNREFRHMLGFEDSTEFPNELGSWTSLLHPEDKEYALKALNDMTKDRTGEEHFDIEYRLKTRDGNYKWFRSSAEASRRSDGSVSKIVGTFVDIDQRKKAQILARKGEAFHNAFTKGNMAEYLVDVAGNRFESLKTGNSLLTTYERCNTWDEVMHSYIDYFVAPESKEEVAMVLNRYYIQEKFKEEADEITLDCRIRVNGKERWVRNVVMPGYRKDDNLYAVVIVRDITDIKNDEALMKGVNRKNEILDQLFAGIFRLIEDFALIDLDENLYRFYSMNEENAGYKQEGRYDRFLEELASTITMMEEGKKVEEELSVLHLQKILKNMNEIHKFEFFSIPQNCYKNMAVIPLSFKKKKVERVMLITQNITEEKRVEMEARSALEQAYEAANNANRAKTEFLSNMSHDIRPPMNAIVGMTAIAGANIDNPDRVKDCLAKTAQASRHLLSLINEVLDMSRIESGRFTLKEEDFKLSDLVDNLLAMTETEMEAHQHQFKVVMGHIEHENVCGDSLRIQQVITNVMSNAIKYTPNGGHILFSLVEKPGKSNNRGCYEFVVEDDGIGMTEEFLERIFDPFVRADDKRSGKIQGTGLGMTIAKNIVQMMGGDIRVESQLGKGSKFTIVIYLRFRGSEKNSSEKMCDSKGVTNEFSGLAKRDGKAPEKESLKQLKNTDYKNRRILLVEDNELNREIATEILEMTGAAVEEATDGKMAVDMVEEKPTGYYDLIFMDIQMPVMNGYEAAAAIRALENQKKSQTPIVAMTANAFAEDVQMAKNAGMNEHLAKPLEIFKLKEVLKRWL